MRRDPTTTLIWVFIVGFVVLMVFVALLGGFQDDQRNALKNFVCPATADQAVAAWGGNVEGWKKTAASVWTYDGPEADLRIPNYLVYEVGGETHGMGGMFSLLETTVLASHLSIQCPIPKQTK